jgi:ankyrin repeat protein
MITRWRGEADHADQLLHDGADPNARDIEGRTPLMHAVLGARMTSFKLLLQHRANVNLLDHGGFSALHFAAQNFELDAAEELLRAGAQMELKDSFEMIALLLRHGAGRLAKNNNGKTPVDLATLVANYDLKQFFQEKAAE